MAWRVEVLPAADKAFGRLDRQYQRRIQKFIETRLQTDNDPHGLGEAYTGPLKGYWKYRIGDYRLVWRDPGPDEDHSLSPSATAKTFIASPRRGSLPVHEQRDQPRTYRGVDAILRRKVA